MRRAKDGGITRRHAMSANLIFKRLRDRRYTLEPPTKPDAAFFLNAGRQSRTRLSKDRALSLMLSRDRATLRGRRRVSA